MDKKYNNPEFIKNFCINENFIARGGNGIVYEIPNDNTVIKILKLSFEGLKLRNRFEEKKYARFKDEIKVVIEYQDIVKNKNIHESVLVGNIYKYLVDEFLMKTKLVTRIEIEISKDIANDYDFKLEDVLDNLKEIYFEYKEEAIHDYITKSDTLTLKDITEDFFYNNKLWDIYTETYLGYVCIDRLKDIVSNKS